MTEHTQIRISTDTRDALKEVGNMNDTYDSLIYKMIDVYKTYLDIMAKRTDPDNGAP